MDADTGIEAIPPYSDGVMRNVLHSRQIAMLLGVLTLAGFAAQASTEPAEEGSTKLVPLVRMYDQGQQWLDRAERFVAEGKYGKAIEVYQALIEKPHAGFVPLDKDNRRYGSLRTLASEKLGQLPPEALQQYRRLIDPKAKRKLDDALATGDHAALLEVATLYRHSSLGPQALRALGALEFDRGLFHQAARTWQHLLDSIDQPEPALAGQIAIAQHLAGQTDQARKGLAELKDQAPTATAHWGGQEVEIVAFVTAVLDRPVPAAASQPAGDVVRGGWSGQPTSAGPEKQLVLAPRWRRPVTQGDHLTILAEDTLRQVYSSPDTTPRARLRNGHVKVEIKNRRGSELDFIAPALLRPVLVGQQVLLRDDQGVTAWDLFTGQMLWKTDPKRFALYRTNQDDQHQHYYGGQGLFTDGGQYDLTIGGDALFILHSLPPNEASYAYRQNPPTGSCLTALSLPRQGAERWTIGLGKGSDELLRQATFLSLPCWIPASGTQPERLFVIALWEQSYQLLCLNAETGQLLWAQHLAQTPTVTGHMPPGWKQRIEQIGTPPVVRNGRVYVQNNAGVLACFQADTGQALWAYQYQTPGSSSQIIQHHVIQARRNGQALTSRVNPLVVDDETLLALPADSEKLLCLSTETGRLLWSTPTQSLRHLTPVDNARFALSGGGLALGSRADGKIIHRSKLKNPVGRPAVTDTSLLICTDDTIARVSLDDYSVQRFPPVDRKGLLGNLLVAQGNVIAANIAGICAYLGYDDAYDVLTERIDQAQPNDAPALLIQRAGLSMTAGEYQAALADYLACREKLASLGQDEARKIEIILTPRLQQAYLARGDHPPAELTGQELIDWRLKMYGLAEELASTDQQKARMLIRLAKFHEDIGQFGRATSLAQQLSDTYPEEMIGEVVIGPAASYHLVDQQAGLEPARLWAQNFIRRLIRIHGPEVYADINRQARDALDQAGNDPHALRAVAKRWPNSQAAFDALLAAAESYYRSAETLPTDQATKALAEARALLGRLSNTENPHRISATAALLAFEVDSGAIVSANYLRETLQQVPAQTPIAFADLQGPLDTVLARIDRREVTLPTGRNHPQTAPASNPTATPAVSLLRPPLARLYTLADPPGYLLCDQAFRPVRVGSLLLAQRGFATCLLDPAAPSADLAVKGMAMIPIPSGSYTVGRILRSQQLIAATSNDGTIAAIASPTQVVALNFAEKSIAWKILPGAMNIGKVEWMGIGDDRVVLCGDKGIAVGLDIRTGKVAWRIFYLGDSMSASAGPIFTDGVMILRGRKPSTVGLYDAAGGKLLWQGQADSGRAIGVRTSPAGHIATLVDGELTGRATDRPGRAILTRTYRAEDKPMLLACSEDRLAVLPKFGQPEIHLLSLTDPSAEPVVLDLATREAPAAAPARVLLDDQATTVLFSPTGKATPASHPTWLQPTQGLGVMRFSHSGQRLWMRILDDSAEHLTLGRPVADEKYLVIYAHNIRPAEPSACYLVERSGGKVMQTITLAPGKEADEKQVERNRRIGMVFMVDGRLCVETFDGIGIFGAP